MVKSNVKSSNKGTHNHDLVPSTACDGMNKGRNDD